MPMKPRRGNAVARTSRTTPKKPTSARKSQGPDLTRYADRGNVTEYHKLFARWIITHVGFDPASVTPRMAFLMGVSIATTTRSAFTNSAELAEWYETTGQTKPGRKPSSATASPTGRKNSRNSAPVVEDDEDEFEESEDDFDDEDEFDDEEESEDDFDDSDDDDDDDDADDDGDDDFEDAPPAPVTRRQASSASTRKAPPAKATRAAQKAPRKSTKAAPAPRGKKATAPDDDELVF